MAGLALMPLGHDSIYQIGDLSLGTMGSLKPSLSCCAVALNAQAGHVHACFRDWVAGQQRTCAAAFSLQLPLSLPVLSLVRLLLVFMHSRKDHLQTASAFLAWLHVFHCQVNLLRNEA